MDSLEEIDPNHKQFHCGDKGVYQVRRHLIEENIINEPIPTKPEIESDNVIIKDNVLQIAKFDSLFSLINKPKVNQFLTNYQPTQDTPLNSARLNIWKENWKYSKNEVKHLQEINDRLKKERISISKYYGDYIKNLENENQNLQKVEIKYDELKDQKRLLEEEIIMMRRKLEVTERTHDETNKNMLYDLKNQINNLFREKQILNRRLEEERINIEKLRKKIDDLEETNDVQIHQIPDTTHLLKEIDFLKELLDKKEIAIKDLREEKMEEKVLRRNKSIEDIKKSLYHLQSKLRDSDIENLKSSRVMRRKPVLVQAPPPPPPSLPKEPKRILRVKQSQTRSRSPIIQKRIISRRVRNIEPEHNCPCCRHNHNDHRKYYKPQRYHHTKYYHNQPHEEIRRSIYESYNSNDARYYEKNFDHQTPNTSIVRQHESYLLSSNVTDKQREPKRKAEDTFAANNKRYMFSFRGREDLRRRDRSRSVKRIFNIENNSQKVYEDDELVEKIEYLN